jgi:hypothetical protein
MNKGIKYYKLNTGRLLLYVVRPAGKWMSWALATIGFVGLSALAVVIYFLHHHLLALLCLLLVIILLLFVTSFRLWERVNPEVDLMIVNPRIWPRPDIAQPTPYERWCQLGIINHSGHLIDNVRVAVQSSTVDHGGVVTGGFLELYPSGATVASVASSDKSLVFVKVISQDWVEGDKPSGWRIAYGPGQSQAYDTSRIEGEADLELVVQSDGPHLTRKYHITIDQDGFAQLISA